MKQQQQQQQQQSTTTGGTQQPLTQQQSPTKQEPQQTQQQQSQQPSGGAAKAAAEANELLHEHHQRGEHLSPAERHQIRVEAGRKAVEHRDPEELRQTLEKSREASHHRTHEQYSEAARKAVQHRDPEELKQSLQKAREASQARTHEEKSAAAQKAAEHRMSHEHFGQESAQEHAQLLKEDALKATHKDLNVAQKLYEQMDQGKVLPTRPEEQKRGRPRTRPGERIGESIILERGQIYFFYSPKVDHQEAHSIDDVSKMFVLLTPKSFREGEPEPAKQNHRLLVMGRKKLPETQSRERYFGFVARVTPDIEQIVKGYFRKDTYHTDTKGDRVYAGARPAGRGVYAIVAHGTHCHLAYVLELPQHVGDVQKALNITPEGSYIVEVKNPTKPARGNQRGLTPEKAAHYPPALMEEFQNRRYARLKPDFLDFEGAELMFVGASDNLVEELGKAGEELEEDERVDAKKLSDAQLFEELRMGKEDHPPEPLLHDSALE